MISVLISGCGSGNAEKAGKLNNEGIDFMEAQNYSSAKVKFQEALQLEPSAETKSELYRNLSTVFFNLDEMDSSAAYSRKAYEAASPGSYLYLLNKAEYQLMKGKIREAIPLLEKAQAIEPEKMETYSNLNLIYNGNYGEKFMNLPKALKSAQKAFELNASAANQEQLASVYFQLENFNESTWHYTALMKKFPEVQLYRFYAGHSMFLEGKADEGIALMEAAADRDEQCRQMLDELLADNVN